jgi:hypothetical protein
MRTLTGLLVNVNVSKIEPRVVPCHVSGA